MGSPLNRCKTHTLPLRLWGEHPIANQTTTWNYDPYGRVTNKLDQAGAEILRYAYDADSRLTNRWSAEKGNTGYAYDPAGNLTNVAYPASGTVQFAYDPLNRLTNMVDSLGATRYTYTAAGQLLTEDGPFTSDTVTNIYTNRRRVGLSLQQPTGLWTNGFGWDGAGRLTNVTSPAGGFRYTYTALGSGLAGRLVQELGLPNGAYITNFYDPVARVLGTLLKNSGGTTLDAALYGYNEANQRTASTNAAGAYIQYSYDNIGQLKVADSSTNSEDRGYAYDSAWNLNWRTNGTSSTYQYSVDVKNELTNYSLGSLTYDANGNLTSEGTGLGEATLCYDDENRLTYYGNSGSGTLACGDIPSAKLTDVAQFYYDGFGRLRERVDYTGVSRTETHYIYDGWRAIQERDSNNVPVVSYTRGIDLSGSLEGAGGIGGLLARSSGYSSGNWTSHAYYHADGNGNITCLVDTNQSVVASYRYDPFGNTISQSGTLAAANLYRFSSKEIHINSGMYYYGYRFYDPSLQRWINRDPAFEAGGFNLYRFADNAPLDFFDPWGLQIVIELPPVTIETPIEIITPKPVGVPVEVPFPVTPPVPRPLPPVVHPPHPKPTPNPAPRPSPKPKPQGDPSCAPLPFPFPTTTCFLSPVSPPGVCLYVCKHTDNPADNSYVRRKPGPNGCPDTITVRNPYK